MSVSNTIFMLFGVWKIFIVAISHCCRHLLYPTYGFQNVIHVWATTRVTEIVCWLHWLWFGREIVENGYATLITVVWRCCCKSVNKDYISSRYIAKITFFSEMKSILIVSIRPGGKKFHNSMLSTSGYGIIRIYFGLPHFATHISVITIRWPYQRLCHFPYKITTVCNFYFSWITCCTHPSGLTMHFEFEPTGSLLLGVEVIQFQLNKKIKIFSRFCQPLQLRSCYKHALHYPNCIVFTHTTK